MLPFLLQNGVPQNRCDRFFRETVVPQIGVTEFGDLKNGVTKFGVPEFGGLKNGDTKSV